MFAFAYLNICIISQRFPHSSAIVLEQSTIKNELKLAIFQASHPLH